MYIAYRSQMQYSIFRASQQRGRGTSNYKLYVRRRRKYERRCV